MMDNDSRYSRQVILGAIGEEGQRRLAASTVGVVGLGGLGSVSAQYLCAAGVGRLVLVDCEAVEESNLNRQIIHGTGDVGVRKVDSAARRLEDLNPNCELVMHDTRVNGENAVVLLKGVDVIVDATDNLPVRKHLNRASIELGLPFVFGGVDGFGGMATVFLPGKTGCLECLFPAATVTHGAPGVIGPLPGMVASIQALETIKLLVGMAPRLAGRLLVIDGEQMSFRTVSLESDPRCKVCGTISGDTNG